MEIGVDGQCRPADEAALDDRRRRPMSHEARRSSLDGALAQPRVEDVTAQRDRVIGQVAVAWPGGGGLASSVDEPYPCEPVSAEVDRIDAQERQLAQGPRRQRIAARLVSGDRPLLDHGDMVARSGQPGGDRRSGGSTTDDEDVGVQGACRQPADAGEPGTASGPMGMISASPITGASVEV